MRLRWRLFWASLVVLLAIEARAASDGCERTDAPNGAYTIDVAGHARTFVVRTPTGEASKRRPLVVAFHGFTQRLAVAERMFDLRTGWPEAVVVYPQGLDRPYPRFPGERQKEFAEWDGPGWQVAADELGDRDVAFFDAILIVLRERACIDPARIFLVGFSNGAYFANLLACLRPGVIAAIAPVSGGMRCTPKTPVPAILFHGRHDDIVSFSEGADAARAWGRAASCAAPTLAEAPGCVPRPGCTTDVSFCSDEGSHAYRPDVTRRAVEFFQRHARR